MHDQFITQPLMGRQVDQAFPIVQSFVPGLDVDRWRSFADRYIGNQDRDSGIMTVQAGGYIHGLFSYSVEGALAHERTLLVDNFLVLDLFNPSGVASALVGAVDTVAHNLRCDAVHTALPLARTVGVTERTAPGRTWLVDRFRALGHEVESVLVCKRLAGWADLPDELSVTPFPAV